MKEEELLALLRLQATKNIGDIIAKKLIAIVGSAEQIFKEKQLNLQKINGIGTYVLKSLFDKENLRTAENELKYIYDNNISCNSYLDHQYPKHLKQCVDGPILFFKDGNFDFSNQRIISIVGTRNMTSYGNYFCEQFMESIQVYNPIIVSGLAYGVDICAHKLALKYNLQTIAVLAHGLDQIYPKTHNKYVHKIIENGGLITEFWHNTAPLRENFLKRNRIVAGISAATIVVESAKKGGSLITAELANSYNKDVFAVPGRTNDYYSQGCNSLIKLNKAAIITEAADVVKMLNWETIEKKQAPVQRQLFVELSDDENTIVQFLTNKEKESMDLISLETGVPVYKLSSILIQLELKGIVKPLPGKMFEII